MDPPETRYAKSGEVSIVYQVVGNGDLDLVFVPGFVSNLDRVWENPLLADFFSRLTRFSRLMLFDKRGTACPIEFRAFHIWKYGWTMSGQ